jgi:transcription initiation factor TFIIE subunit alpha
VEDGRPVQLAGQEASSGSSSPVTSLSYTYRRPTRSYSVLCLDQEQENKGYICPNCKKTYLPLDIPTQLSESGDFLCDVCTTELVDNEESMGVQGEKDKMASFNGQTKWIQEGLRKTGETVFPRCVKRFSRLQPPVTRADPPAVDYVRFDIKLWLAENARTNEPSESAIQVDLQLDADQERKAREQARLSAEQRCGFFLPRSPYCFVLTSLPSALDRTQNVLPSWHLFSTVSGQQTALGIAHAAQAESSQAAAQAAADGQDAQRLADEHHQQCAYPFSPPVYDGVRATDVSTSSAALEDYYKSRLASNGAQSVKKEEPASSPPTLKRSRSPSPALGLGASEGKRAVRSSMVSCWRRTPPFQRPYRS